MSAYSQNETQFKDGAVLCEALAMLGYTAEQVEVYKMADNLYGYHGDKREDTANIIIRRKFVGYGSNDIGFKLGTNGTYSAIISEYDSQRHGEEWLRKLKAAYAERAILKQAKLQGMKFAGRTTNNGKVQLCFVQA
jgi:hypothetical protein